MVASTHRRQDMSGVLLDRKRRTACRDTALMANQSPEIRRSLGGASRKILGTYSVPPKVMLDDLQA